MATNPHPTPAEVATYIARMLTALEDLAEESKLQMLAYLVGLAKEEAEARAAELGEERPRRGTPC